MLKASVAESMTKKTRVSLKPAVPVFSKKKKTKKKKTVKKDDKASDQEDETLFEIADNVKTQESEKPKIDVEEKKMDPVRANPYTPKKTFSNPYIDGLRAKTSARVSQIFEQYKQSEELEKNKEC